MVSKKQREKASAAAEELHFEVKTSLSPDEIVPIVERSAEASGSKFEGSFKLLATRRTDDGLVRVDGELRGPGGLVRILGFAVVALPAPDGTKVNFGIQDYLFQKGGAFSGPTINGAKRVKKFRTLVLAELTAA